MYLNVWNYSNVIDDFIYTRNKKDKGVWRMPRLSEAKKDVISCEKLGVGANDRQYQDVRMG